MTAGLLVAVPGCSSSTDGAGDAVNGATGGATNYPGAGGGGVNPGGGGVNPGAGGVNPGAGGVNPGGGGVNPGAGGINPGAGGGGGGVPSTGGAAGGSATGGGGGTGPVLAHCDQATETGKMPLTQACGDFVTPTGVKLQFGPAGAIMDNNVGKGFENAINAGDMPGSATCAGFASLFGEDPKITTQLLDTGDLNFALYTVFRPATWPEGKLPVLSWGNGTCAQPEGYGALLRYVASFGYFIVAPNSRFVGSGAELKKAIDFAEAANKDPASPYYQHLDTTKVGVMGHSQGSQGAAAAASDARVKYAILFNLGLTTSKPSLAVSGELDITNYTAASMASAINAAPKAASLFYHHPAGMGGIRGHLVLMMTPDRVTDATLNWWEMLFRDDAKAKGWFVGASCGLCGHTADYEFTQHGL